MRHSLPTNPKATLSAGYQLHWRVFCQNYVKELKKGIAERVDKG